MKIRWLRTALRNLDEEASYVAADDPAAARLVVARFLEAVAQSAINPDSVGRDAFPARASSWSRGPAT